VKKKRNRGGRRGKGEKGRGRRRKKKMGGEKK